MSERRCSRCGSRTEYGLARWVQTTDDDISLCFSCQILSGKTSAKASTPSKPYRGKNRDHLAVRRSLFITGYVVVSISLLLIPFCVGGPEPQLIPQVEVVKVPDAEVEKLRHDLQEASRKAESEHAKRLFAQVDAAKAEAQRQLDLFKAENRLREEKAKNRDHQRSEAMRKAESALEDVERELRYIASLYRDARERLQKEDREFLQKCLRDGTEPTDELIKTTRHDRSRQRIIDEARGRMGLVWHGFNAGISYHRRPLAYGVNQDDDVESAVQYFTSKSDELLERAEKILKEGFPPIDKSFYYDNMK